MTLSETEAKQRDELVARLFSALVGGLELYAVYLGDTLGLYRVLAERGPATSSELATRAKIAERYAREWLEQQAVAGILTVDDVTADADRRRYALPPAHAEPLLDRDSPNFIAAAARMLPPVGLVMPQLLDAYRSGGGLAWDAYGDDLWQGQGEFNRPFFVTQLVPEVLARVPDLHAKLEAGARVADIACGVGWSSVAIAKAYPKTKVDGFDLDARAIAEAQRTAKGWGLADRARFQVGDAAALGRSGYDLVTIFEAVHDLSRPIDVLRGARAMLNEGGTVLVMDERVQEAFTAPADEVERAMYMYSLLFCLPNGLAEQPSAATGTVMRPATMRRYAREAGFRDSEVLPIEHPFFRFYRLV